MNNDNESNPKQGFWQYFTKLKPVAPTDKKAKCNICSRVYSYISTTHNLKSHLIRLHPEVDINNEIYVPVKIERLWQYFSKLETDEPLAMCNICGKVKKWDVTGLLLNFKEHMRKKHPQAYKRWKLNLEPATEDFVKEIQMEVETQDEDEASKHPELWTYFEREGDGARCVICEATFQEFSSDDLKAHMLASHPKLMEQVARQENHTVGASSEGEEYKEVVYLEAESSPEVETEVKYDTLGTEYPSETQSAFRRKPHRRTPKRQRESVSSDDSPKKRQTSDNDDELESFATYIRCLLKSLPPDVFRKVQLDVVNVILNARSNYSNTGLSSGVNNGFIVLDGKTIPGSVAVSLTEVAKSGGTLPNYNITVTPSTPGSGKSGEH